MQVARQQQDVTFVGMAGRDGDDAIGAFVERHGIDAVMRTTVDRDGTLWSRLGAVGQPTWLFVDGETGRVEKVFGELGRDGLAERARALASGG